MSMSRNTSRLACFALPLFLLAACSQEPAADAEGDAPGTEDAQPLEDATLDLQATGIVVPAQNGFEQLDVPFGSMRVATETTLANVLGEIVEQGENTECGAGPLQFATYDGLTLYFLDDQFAGYMARTPYVPELSRAEMLADPGVAMTEGSTLGEEFTIGDTSGPVISGLFAGTEDTDSVSALWAGTSCNFR